MGDIRPPGPRRLSHRARRRRDKNRRRARAARAGESILAPRHRVMMSKARVGGWLWVLCLQYFVAEAVAISGWPGPYSLSRDYISDLGAVGCGVAANGSAAMPLCSPLHAVMNASLFLQGLLIVGGTALVWSRFPKGALWTVALLLVGGSGFGVSLVGLAPEDALPGPHFLGATENFLFCNAGMAVMGVAMLRERRGMPLLGLVTFAAGIVGLLGVACLGVALVTPRAYLGLGAGGMERLVAYPFPLWIAAMGAMLLRGRGLWAQPPSGPTRQEP
ncbi:MAG: DUF998 domain-containing protein [Bradyrhizobium sp.]|nr:MAG: DUF998 domain-containing protein [Bradyrhizobium sp.]